MKHYDEYDIWRLTILLYVDFSTEMVRRHVTSGKGYVQRKYKKYAYDEFDIWFSTRIQSIINVICGKSVEFCDYKYHYFRSISNKLSAAWEKRTNESLIENFLFLWSCLYLCELWVPHYMQAVGSKKAVVNHAFLICTPLSWGRGYLLPPRPTAPHRLEGK